MMCGINMHCVLRVEIYVPFRDFATVTHQLQ